MDKNYFDSNEDICYDKLIAFNKDKHYFTQVERQEEKAPIDVMATGRNNSTYAIELKYREKYDLHKKHNYYIENDKGFTGDTVFLESHKAAALLFDYLYDQRTPLYINFWRNGYITVHDIANLQKKPELSKQMNIKSKGYEKFEISKRYLLPVDDCTIYDDQYKIIERQKGKK